MFYWNPGSGKPQWWINGFDTNKMSPVASELEADYWINFSSNTGLFRAFRDEWEPQNHSGLTFNDTTKTVTFHFEGVGQ